MQENLNGHNTTQNNFKIQENPWINNKSLIPREHVTISENSTRAKLKFQKNARTIRPKVTPIKLSGAKLWKINTCKEWWEKASLRSKQKISGTGLTQKDAK